MMVKNILRPGNSSQAKPKAANAAIKIGMIVPGMETAKELRNAPPKLFPTRVMVLPCASL